MKSFLIPLAVLFAVWTGSIASAAVFVHAGPVSVAVGRPVGRPVGYARPVYRPVVRPVLPVAAPVILPRSAPVVVPTPSITPADVINRRQALRALIYDRVRDAVEDARREANQ